jgi:hypothetical protein
MIAVSQTFRQTTFEDLLSATGLLGSQAGVKPCGSPDGPQIVPCGLEVVPVNRFRRRANAKASKTSDTSGQKCFGLSEASARLSSSANRSLQRLVTGGSTEYVQTWKEKVTPSGVPYLEHTASAAAMSDRDCIGRLPTPRSSMGDHMICWSRAESGEHRSQLEDYLAFLFLKAGGVRTRGLQPNPYLCQTVMGFPASWLASGTR